MRPGDGRGPGRQTNGIETPRADKLFWLHGVTGQLRQKAIAIFALLALLLGAVPAWTSELLDAPAMCACCQSGLCPMHRAEKSSGHRLCGLHEPNDAHPCSMSCCHPQSTHVIANAPFVLTAPGGISGPAFLAFDLSSRNESLLSAAREVTPPPPRTILA